MLKIAKNFTILRNFREYCLIIQLQNQNFPCFIDYEASPGKNNHIYGCNCHRGGSIGAQKSQKSPKIAKKWQFLRYFGEYCLIAQV